MGSELTTSQTIGPFLHAAWEWAFRASQNAAGSGRMVELSGMLFDGNGAPVTDGVLEAWTPDAASLEQDQPMAGFRRVATDDNGRYCMRISLPSESDQGAPAAFVTLFARGLQRHVYTVVFLEDDSSLDRSDILAQVPEARRNSLIARRIGDGQYAWDIWLQTAKETVFFDFS